MLSDRLAGISFAASPGCCVGVLSGDHEPEFMFTGHCSVDGNPISADTLWEAASLTKPVVALLAVETMSSDPDLLDRALCTDVEAIGATDDVRWNDVTLRHALTHTTGLPNWRSAGEPLSFESDPGTPGYSGEAFELLLIELASRSETPTDLLLRRFLQRLGLTSSAFAPELRSNRDVAIGHTDLGEALAKQTPSAAKASGSLHTTAADYLRFLSMVVRPSLVVDPALGGAARTMHDRFTEVVPGHGRTLGWAFTNTSLGDVLWQHGDNPGYKHIAALRPTTGDAVVVFTNADSGQAIYRDVCKRLLDVDVW